MKKILFCSHVQKSKELGGSKVVVELAEAMHEIGWDCQVICPADIAAPEDSSPLAHFPSNLRQHLRCHAEEYDVVDYDHAHLPYPRSEFSSGTLMVARSVILAHHLAAIRIPQPSGIRTAIGRIIRGHARDQWKQKAIERAQTTVEHADLVNVSNDADKAELMRHGIDAFKIAVIPYGISSVRRPMFNEISSKPPVAPVVAFVGTFDYRKGAKEFPDIVSSIAASVPGVRFKLMGTKGLFQTEEKVRSHFSRHVQQQIEVIPTYQSDDLPQMLSCCSIGIFPSHMEGFGFGVLEMLAASVPVIAYDAPGPPMMLPSNYLVPRGHAAALADKTISLLQDQTALENARVWAKQQSQTFAWDLIAQQTSDLYAKRKSSRETE